MKRALAIAALATVAAAHPVAPVAAAASPEHVTQAHQPVLGGGGARGSFWLADAPAKPGRHSADRWAEILLASPLSIAQGSSEWWVRQYRLVFGQGDSAISSAVGSFGVGVIGGVPRLFLLLLCTMLSIVLAVTIWSIAFEAVDYSDPFVVGAPKAAEASLAQGAPLLPLQPQPQQPLQGRLSLPPRAWPAPTGALPPPLCPALILPHGVAQFRIPVDSLHNLRDGTFPVPVLGPSGLPVLHAWLPRGTGPAAAGPAGSARRWLHLTTTTTSRHPHAKVGPITLNCFPEEPIEIRGPGGDAYGTLQCGDTGWGAMHSGALVLFIDTTFPYPHLSGFAADGRPLASAAHSRGTDQPMLHGGPDIEALVVSAKPGSDALLALLCMLAVVLMSPKFSTLGARF